MLYNYRFKNLWSFAEETEVSFVLNQHAPEIDSVFQTPRGVRLSKLMAVHGANGAGKTNILKVLAFLGRFVERSFTDGRHAPISISKHIFSEEENSEIQMEFEHDGKHYRYRLVANKKHVVHESLHTKIKSSFRYIFCRDLSKSGGYAIRQKGFDFPQKQAERARSNVSLISAAAQYGVPCALKLTDYFSRIGANITLSGSVGFQNLFEPATFFYKHPALHEKMVRFMSQVDLGLSDIFIETMPLGNNKVSTERIVGVPYGIHRQGKKKKTLDFLNESSGTKTTFELLQKILPILERGGIAVLDELDAGLHPDMVMALLGLFTDSESNPHHAQIIFTSYVPDVMDTLLKEQILLVEKTPDGYSEAWRLDDMKSIRRDENYYGKYRAGAYGAIPDI